VKWYDVVVVGAGPAGSYAAHKLAEMGYGVAVVEQKERLGEQVCCTGIISQGCISDFDIDEDVILRRANSATLVSPSGRSLRLWRQETQAAVIDRAVFDVAMAKRAQDKGAEYLLNSRVNDIEAGDDRVGVAAIRRGEKLDFEARAVVIATGFGSGLVHRLDLGRVSDFVMGAQAEVEVVGIDEVQVYFGQEVAPGFFAWLVPTLPSRALVGLLSRRNPEIYLRKLIASLIAEEKIVSAEAEPSFRGISLKPLAKTYTDRLVVVGDAAGQVKPVTGGGIYYGLLCAEIAAKNLHRALESDSLSADGLAGYEREWRRKLGSELKIGRWARKFYERLSDAQIDRLFDIIKSRGIDKALLKAKDLSFDGHGEVVLSLIRRRVLSTLGAIKVP
jgi:geranylgeranyl reductase family protein